MIRWHWLVARFNRNYARCMSFPNLITIYHREVCRNANCQPTAITIYHKVRSIEGNLLHNKLATRSIWNRKTNNWYERRTTTDDDWMKMQSAVKRNLHIICSQFVLSTTSSFIAISILRFQFARLSVRVCVPNRSNTQNKQTQTAKLVYSSNEGLRASDVYQFRISFKSDGITLLTSRCDTPAEKIRK